MKKLISTNITHMEQNKENSPRVFESRDLFDKEKLIIIRHENNSYRLMITKQGKLILNK